MSDSAKKLFMWSGGNNFKLNADGTPNAPSTPMSEAAQQREQIRKEQAEWEVRRTGKNKVPDLIAQLLKAIS